VSRPVDVLSTELQEAIIVNGRTPDVLDGHAPAVKEEDQTVSGSHPGSGLSTPAPQYSRVPGRGSPANVRLRQRAQFGHRAGFFRTPEKAAVGDSIEPETLSASEASSGRGWSLHVTCPRSTPFPLGR
jgi:hypothetical protein